jgi:hypothetical protein
MLGHNRILQQMKLAAMDTSRLHSIEITTDTAASGRELAPVCQKGYLSLGPAFG